MERTKWLRHPALRRLPIIAVAAIGIWLWQTGAKDREIYWQLPPERSDIQALRIQLREKDGGALIRGHEFFFDKGHAAPAEVRTEVKVSEGSYDAQVTVKRRGASDETFTRTVQISGEATQVRLW